MIVDVVVGRLGIDGVAVVVVAAVAVVVVVGASAMDTTVPPAYVALASFTASAAVLGLVSVVVLAEDSYHCHG